MRINDEQRRRLSVNKETGFLVVSGKIVDLVFFGNNGKYRALGGNYDENLATVYLPDEYAIKYLIPDKYKLPHRTLGTFSSVKTVEITV